MSEMLSAAVEDAVLLACMLAFSIPSTNQRPVIWYPQESYQFPFGVIDGNLGGKYSLLTSLLIRFMCVCNTCNFA